VSRLEGDRPRRGARRGRSLPRHARLVRFGGHFGPPAPATVIERATAFAGARRAMGGLGAISGPPISNRKRRRPRVAAVASGRPKASATLSASWVKPLVVHGALPSSISSRPANGRSARPQPITSLAAGEGRDVFVQRARRGLALGERREGGFRRGERSPARGRSRAGRRRVRLVATMELGVSPAWRPWRRRQARGRGARRACWRALGSTTSTLAAVSSTSSRSAWKSWTERQLPSSSSEAACRPTSRPGRAGRARPQLDEARLRGRCRAQIVEAAARGRRRRHPPSPGALPERGRAGDQLLDRASRQRLHAWSRATCRSPRRRRPAARSP